MRFRATLQLHGKTATGIRVPDEVVAALGTSKRPPVRVTLNGHCYRTTVAVMGGEFLIPVSAAVRSAAGAGAGDDLEVDIELDAEPREVQVSADLQEALAADPEARGFFEELSNSHKSAYVVWIESAKKDETRQRRIREALQMLRDKRKR
jgi:hypothetical protein